ncbi:unnamed protein product [Phaedon cochleariae]|uniref:Uncharacterized protein n=1 Tax=Phaedon cochleariae TaxID=80249 RepID=A0A9N9X0L1_PHACE|nr:unnamed protein product [Phaedon cochleariae]
MNTTIISSFCLASAMITLVRTQSNLFGEFLRVHNECQVDPATRIEGNLMDMAAEGLPVDEYSLGNHLLCMYIRLRIMSGNGWVDVPVTIEQLVAVIDDKAAVSQAVHRCCGPRRSRETPQQIAAELFRCVTRNLPALRTVRPPGQSL